MRLSVNELNQVKDGLEDVKTSYKSVDALYTVLKVRIKIIWSICQRSLAPPVSGQDSIFCLQ